MTEHEFHDEQKWRSLVFRQDSQRLAILSDSGLAVVYDVQAHEEVTRRTMRGRCRSGVFNSNGDLLVSVFDNPYFWIWNLAANRIIGDGSANVDASAKSNSNSPFSKTGEPCFNGDARFAVIKELGMEAECPGSI